jgi:oligoendopeptidase F
MTQNSSPTETLITERDRRNIPDHYTWDLTPIYPGDDSWRSAKNAFTQNLPQIATFRGTLGQSAQHLADALEFVSSLGQEFARLYTYTSLYSDIDTRDSTRLAQKQEMAQLGSEFTAQTAFIDPEILQIGRDTITSFLADEPRLASFRHSILDVLRRAEHTRSDSEETIIADVSLLADNASDIYTVFSNAEFPFPVVTLHDGTTVKLDKAAFALNRTLPHRGDRQTVFTAYFNSLYAYRRTYGSQLYGEVKKNIFYKKARRYPSCLHTALDANNIPTAVFRGLIQAANEHLPTFHRYLNLRHRLLAVSELHFYDLYVPVVPDLDRTYSFEEARDLVLTSVAPLGTEYTTVATRAFAERWMDVYPNDGKIGGAYSNGAAYDVHPYILLNYNGKYDDVSTVTHELGHTMHSHYANTRQPYPTSHYSIFVAEVASTMNEALLLEHMLHTITERQMRLTLLMNYLDDVRATLFRQTQFAEFELTIHERAERGESLTGDSLNELYLALERRYHGHNEGVCVIDQEMQSEWASVPHFYYNFYVFQYATSLTASSALSEMILAGDKDATKRYIDLLSAGGSDYPIELLQKAGVDMTTPAPFEMMIAKMNRVMDEVERLMERE